MAFTFVYVLMKLFCVSYFLTCNQSFRSIYVYFSHMAGAFFTVEMLSVRTKKVFGLTHSKTRSLLTCSDVKLMKHFICYLWYFVDY